jgi:hypothetical protein
MTAIRNWLKTRAGKALISDLVAALGAGAAVLYSANSWTAAVFSAAGMAVLKALLRAYVPVPDADTRNPYGNDASAGDPMMPAVTISSPSWTHPGEYLPGNLVTTGHETRSAGVVTTITDARARTYKSEHTDTYTVQRRRIPEHRIPGKRLGRHVHHDSRSLKFLIDPDGTTKSARWAREIPVLDQGDVGSCTGNAATGDLGTQPDYTVLAAQLVAGLTLNEAEALRLYSAAETIDGDGPYPPNDNGSSGLSVAKAAKNAGLISGYKHITSLAAAKTAIQTGPFIVGSNWYTGMDNPSANGLVAATGTVRGGHEYSCIGYDADQDLWEFVNSWGASYGVAGHFFYSSATFSKLLSEEGDATVLLPLATPAPAPTPTPTPTPTPASVVTITDPVVVAKLTELGERDGISADDFATDRFVTLYHLS